MPEIRQKNIVIIGGGAAGVFAAIACAENFPEVQVIVLEQNEQLLGKVKISGGGRCNVTNACSDPSELVKNYPRGQKELLGPFHRFGTRDTVAWFEDRGVDLKTEPDNRMFPVTDRSQTIIDCLLHSAEDAGVRFIQRTSLNALHFTEEEHARFIVKTKFEEIPAWSVLFATGSSERTWKMIGDLGHTIIPPVPSLFTFRVRDQRIEGLSGVSVPKAIVSVEKSGREFSGPLLSTHRGFSGPAILKLSAWEARKLFEIQYEFSLRINWSGQDHKEVRKGMEEARSHHPRKKVANHPLFGIPSRLWESLCGETDKNWSDLSRSEFDHLANEISGAVFRVSGKDTFKDEFVTAGGVDLKEVNFKTMESKIIPGLYFAGEVLDIDAVTGGFNFQAAWTTGWIAGREMGN